MNEQTKLIIEKIENELMDELRRIMELQIPPTVKGGSYEDSIKDFFEKYLGSIYDFHTRVSIIDFLGLCFEKFKPIENEFDIVATFRTAIPRIILQCKQQKFVPYDSVAFVIQVKQDLDKGKLKSDLEKLKRIRHLPLNPRRMPVGVEYQQRLYVGSTTMLPVNVLFYLRSSISNETIESLLKEFREFWDFLVIAEDGKLLINHRIITVLINLSMKFVEETLSSEISDKLKREFEKELEKIEKKSFYILEKHPLITLMCQIPIITPHPVVCNSTAFFLVNIFPECLIFLEPGIAEIILEKILKEGCRE